MDRQALGQAVDRQMPALRAIAAALAASVVAQAVVAWVVIDRWIREPIVPLATPIAGAAAFSGLFLILVGYLLGRSIRDSDQRPAAGGPTGDDAGRLWVAALMQRYTRSVVVAAALRESASTVGLVLSLLTADPTWVLVLAGAALLSMLIHWPRRAGVEDWLLRQRIAA
jgi:hypothetical protein